MHRLSCDSPNTPSCLLVRMQEAAGVYMLHGLCRLLASEQAVLHVLHMSLDWVSLSTDLCKPSGPWESHSHTEQLATHLPSARC